MKLLHRLMIAFGLLLLIVTGTSAYLIDSLLLDNLIEQQRKELQLKAQLWGEKVRSSSENEEKLIEELNQLVMSNRKVEILLLGKRKKVIYTTVPGNSLESWNETLERRAEKKEDKHVWMVGDVEYIVVSEPIKVGDNQRLLLATPVRGIKDVRYEITQNIMIILFIGLICSIILSFFITRSLVQPLSSLRMELKKVRERRFSEVKHIEASGEIGSVTEAVYFLAQELDRFHEVQRQFFQNASHELKTPLMSIQGYAEGIRDGIFSGEAAIQGLDVIVEETTRLKGIVTEMILLAKLESEEHLFHPASYAAMEILSQAVDRLQPIALQNGITVVIHHDNSNPKLFIDRDKFFQALINILSNSYRHAREQVEVKVYTDNERVKIEVTDDGEGIAQEVLPNLFHRFVKGKNGENGLGLAISRAIIERSGGTLTARNLDGRGAQFCVWMPVSRYSVHPE